MSQCLCPGRPLLRPLPPLSTLFLLTWQQQQHWRAPSSLFAVLPWPVRWRRRQQQWWQLGSLMPGTSSWPLSGRVQSQVLTLLDNERVLCKQMDCVMGVKALLGEGVGGIVIFACRQSWQKDNASINLNIRGQRSWWQEEEATDEKRGRPSWTGGSGARRGGGGDAITSLAGNVGIFVCRLHPSNDRHFCLLPTCRQCRPDTSATFCYVGQFLGCQHCRWDLPPTHTLAYM